MSFQARLFHVAKIVYTLLHYSFPSDKSSAWNENAYTWQDFFLSKRLARSEQVSTISILVSRTVLECSCWLNRWNLEKILPFLKVHTGRRFSFLNLWLSPILFWSTDTVLMTTHSYESIKHFHMSRLQTLTSHSSFLKCSYPKKKIIRNIFCFWMFSLLNYVVWFLFLIVLTFCLFNTSGISFFTSRITI